MLLHMFFFYFIKQENKNGSPIDLIHISFQPQTYNGSSWGMLDNNVYKEITSVLGSNLISTEADSPLKLMSSAFFSQAYNTLTSGAINTGRAVVTKYRYYYQFENMSNYLNNPCQTYLNFLKNAIDYKVWETKTFRMNPQTISYSNMFTFANFIRLNANNNAELKNDLTSEYNKWTKYFELSKYPVQAKKALSNKVFDENTIFSDSHINYIIYVSIDKPLEKSEMKKNIFAFEHFEGKIIPVGYLANDENTPLKFNVITRDPITFKMKKVNDKPLTYCEAMSYTGEEFSKYCGCRWFGSGVLVTGPNGKGNPTYYRENNGGYPDRIKLCNNNFGCMIRPVKPSLSGRFK